MAVRSGQHGGTAQGCASTEYNIKGGCMSKEKTVAVRVSEKDKEAIAKRYKSIGFRSESEYVLALIKKDIPAIDPARHLKGLDED